MTGAEATLLKVGLTAVQRVAPAGLALVKSWWKGKDLLVVGQPRSGKSTFVDYLQYGLFEDERDTDKTLDVLSSARFNVKLGRDAALELTVRTAVDVPGQLGPAAHADVAFDRRPHAIVVMTDLTRPLRGDADRAAATWLDEFCDRLESRWGVAGRRRNRLRSMVVVLNKADRVATNTIESRKKVFRQIVEQRLRDARGQMLSPVAVVPCVLVTNPDGTKSADSLIAHIAKAMAR